MRRLLTRAALTLCVALSPGALAATETEVTQLLGRVEFWQSRQRDDLAREEPGKLSRLVPDHPGVVQIATLLTMRGTDQDRLRQARQLARAGRAQEAVEAYRAIFPDAIPDDDIALEYAQVLGATPDGWDRGRALLAELAKKHPDEPRFRVALASHLSTRQPVSADTLKSLRELSAIPSVARQAREAWRRAVVAMDASEASLPALREYIAANPGETAVADRLAAVLRAIPQGRKPVAAGAPADAADRRARALREGWDALEAGNLEQAEARLRVAEAQRPKDGEAVGGMGLVRLRQGRHDEAAALFARARALDAAGRAKWEGLERTARYWGLLAQARNAREAGDLDRAATLAKQARALDPKEPNGAIELARVYVAAGHDRDAEALMDELAPAERASIGESIARMRAGRLRDKAKELQAGGRDAEAIAALEQAAALAPLDPWVRHDLARLYAARGERERGQALFDPLLARQPRDADTRYAYALFLVSAQRQSEALAVLDGIAAGERTADMTRLQRRLWVSVQGQRAIAFARQGERAKADEIVESLGEAIGGDLETAIEVAHLLDRMEAGAELSALLERIATLGKTTPEQGEAIAAMKRSVALRRIDVLMASGDAAAARPLVEAALRTGPDDARMLGYAATLAHRDGRIDEAIDYERRAMGAEGGGESWRYRRLAEWLDQRQGWSSSALDWLHRAGTPGKSRVSALELPLAYRQGWSQGRRWFWRVTPARVASGTLEPADRYEASTFGSMLLCQPGCAGMAASMEKGVGLGAGLERGAWRFDLATSPIGFPVVNVLGGAQFKGGLGPASYSLDFSRRPIMSSLLSYAGTRDPNTGRTWGGVVATGARVNLSRDSGGDYGAWGLAGLYRLSGRNVKDNDKAEVMAGLYRRLVNEEDRQFTIGLTGMLWRFSENAGEFTFGHGGYYSPRSYRSLALPVTYGLRTARTSVALRASVSVSWSQSRAAKFFPTDSELQARAEALAPTSFVDPFYAGGNNGRSFGRSLSGAAEHQLGPNVFVGGRLELERSSNYTPNRFLLYVRITTDGPAARPVSLPPEPGLPGFQH